jgi:hypothetical protein
VARVLLKTRVGDRSRSGHTAVFQMIEVLTVDYPAPNRIAAVASLLQSLV